MIVEETAKKPSGVEWIDEIPNHWDVWKASHGFNLIGSGTTPKTDNLEYYGGDVCWVTTSELRETTILDTSTKLTEAALRNYSSLHKYPVGTLLIAMYGATIGRLGILGIEATLNQACCAFARPEVFDTKFFFYWLIYRRPILISLSSGGGQPNLNQEELRSLKVPIPPLEEQQAIATMLDHETARLDELITEKERLLELLAEKRRALITNAVTRGLDPNAPLVDSGAEWLGEIPQHWQIERSRWLFTERDERSSTGEEELLTVSHITGVTPRSEKNVNMFEAETTEGYKLCQKNDLVINTMWAWMGAMGVSFTGGLVSPAYNVYVPNNRIIGKFIDEIVRTANFAKEVTRYSKGVWSSRLRLYPEEFFLVYFPVPPIDEQQEIVEYIKAETGKIDRLQAATRETVELLKERRSSLIAAAVTGKISVRETE